MSFKRNSNSRRLYKENLLKDVEDFTLEEQFIAILIVEFLIEKIMSEVNSEKDS